MIYIFSFPHLGLYNECNFAEKVSLPPNNKQRLLHTKKKKRRIYRIRIFTKEIFVKTNTKHERFL